MNQEQLEALLRQFAPNQQPERLEFTESVESVDAPPDPTAITQTPRKVPVRVLTWVDRGTGQVLRVQANPDNTYTKTFQGTEPKAQGEPSVPLPTAAQQRPQVVPTNTTEPFIVTQQPDGALKQEPNPNYKGEPPKPGTNLHIESNGKHYIVPIDAAGKAGTATVLDIPAEAKPGSRTLVDGGDGQKYIVTIGADNTVTTTDTAGKPVPGGVPPKRDPGTIRYNPETGEYEQVTTDPATGNASVRAVPRQGAAAAGPVKPAPSLPQIVVGQSQDALRTAYDQIQQEVDSGRRTAAWGENRRKEVYDAAHLAVSEAQVIEQSRQANQTTSFNVANAQLGYGQSSLENALKFTLSINDKLKPGSGSGGKMFAALFNMQMAMGIASGMYGMNVPKGSSVGAPGQPPAPASDVKLAAPRLTDPGDPAAVETDHQRSQDELVAAETRRQQALAAPVFRPPPPVAGSVAPPVSGAGAPVTSTPALSPPAAAPVAAPGGSAVPPVPLPSPTPAPGAPPPAAMPATAPAPGFGDPGFYRPDMQGTDRTDPGFYRPDMQGTDRTDPGFYRPLPGAPQGQAQPQGFAALDALRSQYAPQPQAPQIDPTGGLDPATGGIGLPPALQRAQIAATPPWRLPPDQLEALVQQHGEEAVFGWPGQRLLGAG